MPGCAPINLGVSRAFDRHAFQGGGGCMNGTWRCDIVRLLDAIRAGGEPILSKRDDAADDVEPDRPAAHPVRSHRQHRASALAARSSLDPAASGSYLSPGSWQWGGVWGHSWSSIPRRKTTIVNLTNTTLEGMVGQVVRDIQQSGGWRLRRLGDPALLPPTPAALPPQQQDRPFGSAFIRRVEACSRAVEQRLASISSLRPSSQALPSASDFPDEPRRSRSPGDRSGPG